MPADLPLTPSEEWKFALAGSLKIFPAGTVPNNPCRLLAINNKSNRIAVAATRQLSIYDLATVRDCIITSTPIGNPLFQKELQHDVSHLAFSGDGHTLLAATSHSLLFFSVTDPFSHTETDAPDSLCDALPYLHESAKWVLVLRNGNVVVWDSNVFETVYSGAHGPAKAACFVEEETGVTLLVATDTQLVFIGPDTTRFIPAPDTNSTVYIESVWDEGLLCLHTVSCNEDQYFAYIGTRADGTFTWHTYEPAQPYGDPDRFPVWYSTVLAGWSPHFAPVFIGTSSQADELSLATPAECIDFVDDAAKAVLPFADDDILESCTGLAVDLGSRHIVMEPFKGAEEPKPAQPIVWVLDSHGALVLWSVCYKPGIVDGSLKLENLVAEMERRTCEVESEGGKGKEAEGAKDSKEDAGATDAKDSKEDVKEDMKEDAKEDTKEDTKVDTKKDAKKDMKEDAKKDMTEDAKNDMKEYAKKDKKEDVKEDADDANETDTTKETDLTTVDKKDMESTKPEKIPSPQDSQKDADADDEELPDDDVAEIGDSDESDSDEPTPVIPRAIMIDSVAQTEDPEPDPINCSDYFYESSDEECVPAKHDLDILPKYLSLDGFEPETTDAPFEEAEMLSIFRQIGYQLRILAVNSHQTAAYIDANKRGSVQHQSIDDLARPQTWTLDQCQDLSRLATALQHDIQLPPSCPASVQTELPYIISQLDSIRALLAARSGLLDEKIARQRGLLPRAAALQKSVRARLADVKTRLNRIESEITISKARQHQRSYAPSVRGIHDSIIRLSRMAATKSDCVNRLAIRYSSIYSEEDDDDSASSEGEMVPYQIVDRQQAGLAMSLNRLKPEERVGMFPKFPVTASRLDALAGRADILGCEDRNRRLGAVKAFLKGRDVARLVNKTSQPLVSREI